MTPCLARDRKKQWVIDSKWWVRVARFNLTTLCNPSHRGQKISICKIFVTNNIHIFCLHVNVFSAPGSVWICVGYYQNGPNARMMMNCYLHVSVVSSIETLLAQCAPSSPSCTAQSPFLLIKPIPSRSTPSSSSHLRDSQIWSSDHSQAGKRQSRGSKMYLYKLHNNVFVQIT